MNIKVCVLNWFLSAEVEKVEHPVMLVDERENLKKKWNCHNSNDNTTQHNLNTVVGLDTKMTLHTTHPSTPPTPETQ